MFSFRKIIFAIFTLSYFTLSFSQDHKIFVNQRFGLSINDYASGQNGLFSETIEHEYFYLKNDIGTLVGYEYNLFKSTNTYLYAAYEISKAHHTYEVFQNNDFQVFNNNKDKIEVHTRRSTFHLGVRQRFLLLDDKIQIGLGVGFAKRVYPENKRRYLGSADFESETQSVHVDYHLTTFHDGRHTLGGFIPYSSIINFDSDIFVAYQLNDYLSVKLSFMYNRNHYIYYRFGYRATIQNSETPFGVINSSEGYLGQNNSKKFTRSHNQYLSLGIEINLDVLHFKLAAND